MFLLRNTFIQNKMITHTSYIYPDRGTYWYCGSHYTFLFMYVCVLLRCTMYHLYVWHKLIHASQVSQQITSYVVIYADILSFPHQSAGICFFREMISYYSLTALLPHYLTFRIFDIKIYIFWYYAYRTKIEHLYDKGQGENRARSSTVYVRVPTRELWILLLVCRTSTNADINILWIDIS